MCDSGVENAVVPHWYRLAHMGEKAEKWQREFLTHELSNSKEFQERITSVKVQRIAKLTNIF